MMIRTSAVAILVGLTLVVSHLSVHARTARDVIEQRTLDNGLDVILVSTPTVPIVTVELCVKNGAFTEPPELNGLSHLYEHMFFKGNAVIPDQEAYLKRMRELGIVFNGTTGTERVNYYFTLPSDRLREGLVFMKDAITTLRFDEVEFSKEKQVVIGEVDRNESSPYHWFRQAVAQRLWHAHPSRKDSLGDRKTVLSATVEQMQAMKATYYVPNNAALVVSGNVGEADVFALAQEIFGSWERGADPFAGDPIPKHPPIPAISPFVLHQEVQVPVVMYSWHGPSVGEDPRSTYASDVLSYILGQPSSRFQKALVESGVTLGAGVSYYTQAQTGPISLSAQVRPERLKEAVPLLLAELKRVLEPGYITEEQLQSAKTILRVDDLYSRQQSSGFAHTVSFWWAVAGLDYYYDYLDNLSAVTHEDIAHYVRTYVLDKPFVVGAILSAEDAEEQGFTEEALRQLITPQEVQ